MTRQLQIDAVCVQFEQELRGGKWPRIEAFLQGHDEPLRSQLLRHLLQVELEYRVEQGARLEIGDILDRFPHDQSLIHIVRDEVSRSIHAPETEYLGSSPSADIRTDSALSRSDSSLHGRFLPGTKIANRYRIVSLLGKGGMGEVYRADDLRLGHTVALKFLPKKLARDPGRLERFQAEVRLTRQISHPNVCRVYDMDEVDGQQFLSMEFIDGEDLSILLRRIGRLPKDKGIQIAQQLCAGLAAAHDKGVLHRDLKPANIMLDGRGQVRITDFGLARLASDDHAPEFAGTPAYMAPEQLRNGDTTIQSDLYALGLILHEVFTGEAVHKAKSIAELIKQHEDSSPSQPSSVVDDMDPVVERVILRCLEKQPHERPKSAHAVANSLPGGDPLAAALAAGETPSPEMVAAAGDKGLIRPKIALCLFILTLVCIALRVTQDFALPDNSLLGRQRRIELPLEPAVLAQRCRDNLEKLGYDQPFRDSVYGFMELVQEKYPTAPLAEAFLVRFWYRASQRVIRPIQRNVAIIPVYEHNPPRTTGAQAGMRLDPEGRLTDFWAVRLTGQDAKATTEFRPVDDAAWQTLLTVVGADIASLESADSTAHPPVPVDERKAWKGTLVNGSPVRIEAGGYHGSVAWARVISSEDDDRWVDAMFPEERTQEFRAFERILGGFFLAVLTLAVVLAWQNLRRGRSNRDGAIRTALLAIVVHELYWLFSISRLPSAWEGVWGEFTLTMGASLFHGALIGMFYLALEPYVRRWWPEAIIGWTRLLSGRYRDPIVGRDVLVAIAAVWATGAVVGTVDPVIRNAFDLSSLGGVMDPVHLMGIRDTLGLTCRKVYQGSVFTVTLVLLLMASRAVTGRLWPASLIPLILSSLPPMFFMAGAESLPLSFRIWASLFAAIYIGVLLLVVIRFGALAGAVAFTLSMQGAAGPFGEQLNDWSNQSYLWVMTGTVVLAALAFYTSLAGRSVFGAKAEGGQQ